MRKQLVKNFGILIVMLGISDLLLAEDFSIELKTSPLTGALSELRIKGDKYNMNWLVKTDGTQYPWIKENYGWGLGYFTITKDRISIKKEWEIPSEINADGMEVTYREGDVQIRVKRTLDNNGLVKDILLPIEGKKLFMSMIWASIPPLTTIIPVHNNVLIPAPTYTFGREKMLLMSMHSVWELLRPI